MAVAENENGAIENLYNTAENAENSKYGGEERQ
jgi:hypothetical protein